MPNGVADAVLATLGLFCVLTALWLGRDFPVFSVVIVVGIAAYSVLFFLKPPIWLIAVPVSVSAIDFYHWSGRFFATAHDIFLLASLGLVLLYYRPRDLRINKGYWMILISLSAVQALSTINGLLPLTSAPLGNWQDLLASTNALREFKGFAWALVFAPFLLAAHRTTGPAFTRWFSAGMVSALTVAMVGILWERAFFTGLFDFSHSYRISGWLSAMYTGGAALDVFLILAAPFIVGLVAFWRSPLLRMLAVPLAGGALYALYVTYSRADYPAVAAVLLILAFGVLNSNALLSRTKENRTHLLTIGVAAGAGLAILALSGEEIQKRFTTVIQDLGTRTTHWSKVIDLIKTDTDTMLLGFGKGAFPRIYLENSLLEGAPLATILLHTDEQTSFVRLSRSDSNGSLYLRQRFTPPRSGQYRIKVMVRSPTAQKERLMFESCERHIFRYRAECNWRAFDIEPDTTDWQVIDTNISIGKPRSFLFPWISRPVDIALLNRGIRDDIDVRLIQLYDPDGTPLLQNPVFNGGLDHWVISYGNHLRLHIKNVLLYWWFESGFLGLLAMSLILGIAISKLLRASAAGDWFSNLSLASIAGALTLGLFDSLFDEPRIGFLFYFTLFAGLVRSYHLRADFLTNRITGTSPTMTSATAGSAARSHSPSEVSS